jgi:hypothetical protein
MGMAGSDETETAGPEGSYEVRLGVPEDVGSDPDALRDYLMYLADDMSESDRVVIKREHATGGDGGRDWVDITLTIFGGGHCPGRVPGNGDEQGDEDGGGNGDGNGDGDAQA